jgi:hypothetical protein
VTPAELAVLSRTNERAYGRLLGRVLAALGRVWGRGVTSADDAALEAWLAGSVPVVQAGQRASSALSARNTWGILRRSDGLTGNAPATAPELVTADTPWQSSPILRLRKHLGEGLAWEEAHALAGAYAQELATGDLGAAMRSGADQAASLAAPQIDGPIRFAKVPSGTACDWCRNVSRKLYLRADSVSAHLADKCVVSPVTANTPGLEEYTNARSLMRR